MDDAANDPTIVLSLHTANVSRQVRLDPLPLLLAQPNRFLLTIPILPQKRISIVLSAQKN
jgi:hypothetical protein